MPRASKPVEEMVTHVLDETTSVTEKSLEERLSLANKVRNQINRKYGTDTITLGMESVERMPTRLACYDLLTRQFEDGKLLSYGLGRGQYTLIWGASDVGKTCLTHAITREIQKRGPVLFTDAERKFDKTWAYANGVDVNTLHFSKPESMEEFMDNMLTIGKIAAEAGAEIPYLLNIIDSVVSVASGDEMADKDGKERTMGDATIALQPRKLSQFFRMATPNLSKGKLATIWLNQLRVAGIGGYRTFDDFPGGNALRHNCTHIIRAYRSQTKEKVYEELGLTPSHEVRLKVTKGINEQLETNTIFFTECGFDNTYDLMKQLIAYGIAVKSGPGRYQLPNEDRGSIIKDLYFMVEERYNELYDILMNTNEKPSKNDEE